MGEVPSGLLVTGRGELVEEVSSLAAAAGVGVGVVADAAAAGRVWATAPLVLLGDDAARAGVPSRRAGVVLLGGAGAEEDLWRTAVAVGAERVLVLPADRQALLHALAEVAELEGSRAGRAVAVVGARGGAGASLLAAALALRASGTGPALLVDGDRLGGGLDLLVGLEGSPGFRWPDLAGARGTVRAALLRDGLPRRGGLAVLSWGRGPAQPLEAAAVAAVLGAARRSHDAVVLDLPRRDDPATREAMAASDVLLAVVPAEVRAVAAAGRLLEVAAACVADVRLVVVRPARPRSGGLPVAAVVDALGAPLAAVMAPEGGVAAAVERGEPPGSRHRGALARCAEQLDPVLARVRP